MPVNKHSFDYQLRATLMFLEENNFQYMETWLRDRVDVPEPKATLWRVYSQNKPGSTFESRRIHAISSEEAAVVHSRVWPDMIITKIEEIGGGISYLNTELEREEG